MQSPRKPETEAAYQQFKQTKSADERQLFNLAEETVLTDYQYWTIIKSRFPYDTMVRVNDMLILKRPIGRHHEMTEAEQTEYDQIIDELTESGHYDALIENFPKTKSVPEQIHIHLVCWHNTHPGNE